MLVVSKDVPPIPGGRMHIADVVSSKPVTIEPGAPVFEALGVASAHGGQRLVVTEGRPPIGVVRWNRAGSPRIGDDLGESD